jgi:hypothetical protein
MDVFISGSVLLRTLVRFQETKEDVFFGAVTNAKQNYSAVTSKESRHQQKCKCKQTSIISRKDIFG